MIMALSRSSRAASIGILVVAVGCSSTDAAVDGAPVNPSAPEVGTNARDAAAPLATRDAGALPKPPVKRRTWPTCGQAWVEPAGGVSPYDDACVLDERFGVFVDQSRRIDANTDGTRDFPFQSLQTALVTAAETGKHVFACAGVYGERLLIGTELSNDLAIYGGLSCETFLVDEGGARTIVRAEGKGAALRIGDTRGVTIEHVDFKNVGGDPPASGTSYFAASIAGATDVVLRDVNLQADQGAPGADGENAPTLPATAGVAGLDGAAACAANPNLGAGPVSTPGCAGQTTGNSGGDGAVGTGDGGPGNSFGFPNIPGETAAGGWSCSVGSGLGYPPNPPPPGYMGQPGRGARGFGALVGSDFIGFAGQAGVDGSPGQGGSGGGAARAPASCAGLAKPTGASGGGGGSGGCGGKGGQRGGAGGSSIGLLVVDSEVTLEGGAIRHGNGGRGGHGAPGQPGSLGGAAGHGGKGAGGSKAACDGTPGGDGWVGGAGGGGNGGHAIGVLYLGTAPTLTDVAGDTEAATRVGGVPGHGPDSIEPTTVTLQTGTVGISVFVREF